MENNRGLRHIPCSPQTQPIHPIQRNWSIQNGITDPHERQVTEKTSRTPVLVP